MKNGKDMTKAAPVSPKDRVAGFALLPRTIDKCRATLWGNVGEYHYNCAFDKRLFTWKNIDSEQLKAYIAEGHTDEEIGAWVKSHGTPKTDEEIAAWSDALVKYDMSEAPEKKAWLESQNVGLGLDKNAPLMDMLIADDKATLG